jgi:mRNA interferase YafQ
MLNPDFTNKFKKDYQRAIKRNYDISLLDAVIEDLINEIPLDKKYKDHALIGNYIGCRECHIKSDWLLIYQIGNGVIAFERTGTHGDLFR